ncbi:hypothetical protein FRC11_006495 [Ceratobasidium sp. 423]|nr:hypothetical protein FRC11_006495 [Ceratobasidium sp. 423]
MAHQWSSNTGSGPPTSQVGRSVPPPHPSNPDHREVGPAINEDEESDNNPTEGSSFSVSNFGGGQHNHPLVNSVRREPTLAESLSNEPAGDTAAYPFPEKFKSIRKDLKRQQEGMIQDVAEDGNTMHGMRVYREFNEIARVEVNDIIGHKGGNGAEAMEELKEDSSTNIANDFNQLLDDQLLRVEERQAQHFARQRAHTSGSNDRSPSIQARSISLAPSSLVQGAGPSQYALGGAQ